MPKVRNSAATGSVGIDDHSWFKRLFELSPDPTWIIDGNRFVECNEAAVKALGYSGRDELLNVHPSKLSPPMQPDGEDSYVKAERMMALAKEQGLHRFEWTHTKADGTNFVAEVTLSAIELSGRQVIYCAWRDISERKSVERELRQDRAILSAILENFPGGITMVDANLRLIAHNKLFQQLLDLPDSLFEKPDLNFFDILRYNSQRGEYGPGDIEQQIASKVEIIRMREVNKHERIRPNGVVLEIHNAPLPDGGVVAMYLDITERKRLEEQVRQLAFYDHLTGLPNRHLLGDRFTQALAESKRSGHYGALMFLDLDNFKALNDSVGHAAGDLLLQQAAQRMKSCVREVDTVARHGGDEFVVMLRDLIGDKAVATAEAISIAEKIRTALAKPYTLAIKHDAQADTLVEHRCTASIGVVAFIDREGTPDDSLRLADTAMYQAKNAGGNLIRLAAARK